MTGILSQTEIKELLHSLYTGHLACADEKGPYVIPFTYFYDEATNSLVSYTTEGRKVAALRKDPRVCVNVSDIENLNHWKSVVIEGRFEEMQGMAAVEAIQQLIVKLRDQINAAGVDHVDTIADMTPNHAAGSKVVYRVYISEISGRFERGKEPMHNA